MSFYWMLLSFTWLGYVELQHLNGNPALDIIDKYENNFNQFSYNPDYVKDDSQNPDFTQKDMETDDRNRRLQMTIEETAWQPNLVDKDQTIYVSNDLKNPYIEPRYVIKDVKNATNGKSMTLVKRSFSPWGGKRNNEPLLQQTWTWKRETRSKEATMPKRVRFSPWGGKRSGQVLYKPGVKASKLIFSASVPDMSKIISNYPLINALDKPHSIRIMSLSNIEGRQIREGKPFEYFRENKYYKPGHTYTHVDVTKDGHIKAKKSFKFNHWAGKKFQPVIGPIWTPGDNDKERTVPEVFNASPVVFAKEEIQE